MEFQKSYKTVLQQDERAPDSLEYFKKQFEQIVGVEYDEWIKDCVKSTCNEGYFIIWTKDCYRLVCDAGDPFWKLQLITAELNEN